MDPVSSHLPPSTFPCNLCNPLHQADRPTQVPVNLLLVDAECWWPGQLSLLSSTCPCNLFSHLHQLSFNFYAWFLLYLLFIKSTRQVSSLEKYWRQAAGCQEHFSYHCNRFWKINIRLQSMQMSERIQGQGEMVSWQAVDCLKAERERKGAGGRPSGNCHLTSIGPTWPNLQIISSQLCNVHAGEFYLKLQPYGKSTDNCRSIILSNICIHLLLSKKKFVDINSPLIFSLADLDLS